MLAHMWYWWLHTWFHFSVGAWGSLAYCVTCFGALQMQHLMSIILLNFTFNRKAVFSKSSYDMGWESWGHIKSYIYLDNEEPGYYTVERDMTIDHYYAHKPGNTGESLSSTWPSASTCTGTGKPPLPDSAWRSTESWIKNECAVKLFDFWWFKSYNIIDLCKN